MSDNNPKAVEAEIRTDDAPRIGWFRRLRWWKRLAICLVSIYVVAVVFMVSVQDLIIFPKDLAPQWDGYLAAGH